MKILLVDASDTFRKYLSERLRAVPGSTVVGQAGSEEQAMVTASLCAPDVVLADVALRTGSGFSALRRMRASGFNGTAYLLTTEDESDYGPQCVEAGIDGFYDKLLDLERLIEALTVLATAPKNFEAARIRLA